MDTARLKVIDVASLNKAMIIFAGNVCNYGNLPIIKEISPQNPCTRKGTLRVKLKKCFMLPQPQENAKC